MKLKKFFLKQCPHCGNDVSILRAKKSFQCASCDKSIASNALSASLGPCILGGIFSPFIARLIVGKVTAFWYAVDLVVIFMAWAVLYPVLLDLSKE